MTNKTEAIHFKLELHSPNQHLFRVTCNIKNTNQNGFRFYLPAWIPGSYMVRDFAKNIVEINAHDDNGDLPLALIDKQTWAIDSNTGNVTITYLVYAWDQSVRSAHFDNTHAYFNGTSVFIAIEGREHEPVSLEVPQPTHDVCHTWRLATSLRHFSGKPFEFGQFYAKNYDDLIDHPFEIGDFEILDFNVADTPHYIVIYGHGHLDRERLVNDVERICNTQVSTFESFPEMDCYIFHLWVVDSGYGGLEHRNSTSLICSRKDLPYTGMTNKSTEYIQLLGLFSHEYFHTWNVKRIKPIEFTPYQLLDESYTEQLWAFEGITSYYDDLGLLRSNTISLDEYLTLLGKSIQRVMGATGHTKQSLVESSFYTWTKFYKQDENAVNTIVSYYVKGALFALCLDVKIRELTDNSRSLDNVMQTLWNDYGRNAIGVETDTICKIASEVTNTDLAGYFNLYLRSTEELPLNEALAWLNLEIQKRPAESIDDAGGTPPGKTSQPMINLGARFKSNSTGLSVVALHEWSCLAQAGLATGDTIIALNGHKLSQSNIRELLRGYGSDSQIELHYFRDSRLRQATFTLPEIQNNIIYLQLAEPERKSDNLESWQWN